MSNDWWLSKALENEAEVDLLRKRLADLERFYDTVCDLTVRHDVIVSVDGNDYASVSPKKLGEALAKVNPEWFGKISS